MRGAWKRGQVGDLAPLFSRAMECPRRRGGSDFWGRCLDTSYAKTGKARFGSGSLAAGRKLCEKREYIIALFSDVAVALVELICEQIKIYPQARDHASH